MMAEGILELPMTSRWAGICVKRWPSTTGVESQRHTQSRRCAERSGLAREVAALAAGLHARAVEPIAPSDARFPVSCRPGSLPEIRRTRAPWCRRASIAPVVARTVAAQRSARDQSDRRCDQLRDARARHANACLRPGELEAGIDVRLAQAGEKITLLDGKRRADPAALVIADGSGAVGMAGVMGGARSAVSAQRQMSF